MCMWGGIHVLYTHHLYSHLLIVKILSLFASHPIFFFILC